ncbi:MAG: response regulator [Chitinophagaceae bacterium]|nr:MAG: response regulator [Chitinophagaceae bacterium]
MKSSTLAVAIVDDQSIMRDVARTFLLANGYEVSLEAVNGFDLLAQLEKVEKLPDICLLDLNMPEMNGFETARNLRSRFPSIRILAFSLSAAKAQVDDILDCGADGFLPKEAGIDRWRQELAGVAHPKQ